jgi:tRNA 2-thiouridine synthesizing protein A
MVDRKLDATGLDCPLPLQAAKKALKNMPGGEILEILSTDPGSLIDFQAFCLISGNDLVEHGESAGVYRFLVRKATRPENSTG